MTAYVTELTGDVPGWRYGSDLAIYTERFLDGRLLAASFRDNGISQYATDECRDLPAFDLVVDGESLIFGWTLTDFRREDTPAGVRAVLTLAHDWKPVRLTVTTEACGHGFFRRKLSITNTGDTPLSLTAVAPWCGLLWPLKETFAEVVHDVDDHPFSLGHFADKDWGREGDFTWLDLPQNREVSLGSTRGRSGFSHPFCVLRNNIHGGYVILQLAWSANWAIAANSEMQRNFHGNNAFLRFAVRPVGIPPLRIIAPGETVDAPEVHLGISHADFDTAIQQLHAHQRAHVLRTVGDGLQPVIYNHWGYMQHEMSEEGLLREVDIAAEVGAELFIVDAGWYADAETNWFMTTGNWTTGNRLPRDLFPVFEYARARGLRCGLWVEIESAAKESRTAQEHPEWFITRYGHPVERVLDLTKPEVAAYVEREIIRLIERYHLELFRLDYNMDVQEGGFNPVAGRRENTLWRHVEALYGIFDRVQARFPQLLLENCASGGGRTDIGQVSRFTTTWVSDWMLMPRTVRILNGMTMALPPEYVDRMFGVCMNGSYAGSADAQLQTIILGHPALSGLTPSLVEANPTLLDTVKKYVGIYKSHIRPFHRQARVFHHTPVVPGSDGRGWCALEYAAPDGTRAVAGVFRLTGADTDTFRLRFRGLDPARTYRMRSEPDGRSTRVSGYALAQDGVEIRLDTTLTSRLLLLDAEA